MKADSGIEKQLGTPDLLHHELYLKGTDFPWMVMIHGAGGSLVSWKHQVSGFKHLFNLLLLDLRDHGQSKNLQPHFDTYDFDIVTDDIVRLLEHLAIPKAHFLSLSLGSIILQRLHEKKPDCIASMIMAGGVFKADWKIHFFAHSGKFFSYIIPFRWIYDIFSWIVLPRKNHQPSRRLFRLQSQKLSSQEFLKWLGLYRDFFKVVKRFYRKRLETASLVIMGGQDHVFLQAAIHFAHQQAHLAKLVILDGCGHICNIEQAKLFNTEVLHFLQLIDPSMQQLPGWNGHSLLANTSGGE
ncbi:MAG: alpha/beta hydrolase [Saprospiraceae bacterium]